VVSGGAAVGVQKVKRLKESTEAWKKSESS